MKKNGNKKNTKFPNDRYFVKNGVYCNDLMQKTVFIVMILKIKQYEKYIFGNFWQIKVRCVPGIRWSTQYIFRPKTNVVRLSPGSRDPIGP